MTTTRLSIFLTRAWKDRRGQDLLEHALMAGFLAVTAAAIMPGVSTHIGTIFSQVSTVMTSAGAEGGCHPPTAHR